MAGKQRDLIDEIAKTERKQIIELMHEHYMQDKERDLEERRANRIKLELGNQLHNPFKSKNWRSSLS